MKTKFLKIETLKHSLKISNLKFQIPIIALLVVFEIGIIVSILTQSVSAAPPSSTNFELNGWGFGAGGVSTSSSQSYLFQGIAGEIETSSLSSQTFLALPGLTYTLEPNIPQAPSVTNPSSYYSKLNVVINNGNNPSDTTFAIQVASGSANFTSNVYYVSASNNLGTSPVWQTYSSWGSGSGFTMIGLNPGTTYYVRVAAKRGVFQQGAWSQMASAATINPTLTFNLQTTSQASPPYTIAIGGLSAGSVSTSSDKATITISTNATNGALIYLYGTNTGLKSTAAGNYTIASLTSDLSSGSIAEGYGARGTLVTQVSGGPMQIISPYNGVGNNVGIIDSTKREIADSSGSPVTSGQLQFELKAKVGSTTPSANDYSDLLTIIGTASF